MGRCGASGTSWIWGRRGRQMWAWLILLLMVIWEWEGGGNRLVSADLPKPVNFVSSNNENFYGMVYFWYHLVKAHVQTVQNMYGKGG